MADIIPSVRWILEDELAASERAERYYIGVADIVLIEVCFACVRVVDLYRGEGESWGHVHQSKLHEQIMETRIDPGASGEVGGERALAHHAEALAAADAGALSKLIDRNIRLGEMLYERLEGGAIELG